MAIVYIADKKKDGILSVFETDRESQADLLFFRVDKKFDADGSDIEDCWYFTSNEREANLKIYREDKERNADLKVHQVDKKFEAKWRNNHHILKGRLVAGK